MKRNEDWIRITSNMSIESKNHLVDNLKPDLSFLVNKTAITSSSSKYFNPSLVGIIELKCDKEKYFEGLSLKEYTNYNRKGLQRVRQKIKSLFDNNRLKNLSRGYLIHFCLGGNPLTFTKLKEDIDDVFSIIYDDDEKIFKEFYFYVSLSLLFYSGGELIEKRIDRKAN